MTPTHRSRLAGVAALLLVGACNGDAPEPRAPNAKRSGPPQPNVVVILTDTVRADRVSAYGAPRVTTPFFDELARRGFLLENIYAPCSWTRPSVASLFTGTYPQRHGVQMRQDSLPSTWPTLAELLGDAGWNTYILNTNPHVTDTWGMTRGFQHGEHIMPHPDQFKAGNGANTVLRHLRQMAPNLEEPFFLYVHLIDPHWPYEPPRRDLISLGLSPEKAGDLARYDGELHFADRHIATMINVLEGEGYLESSIVVLTADHGDEFHDHGSTGHGKTLYQEVVKVPTALDVTPDVRQRFARQADGTVTTCPRVKANVSLIDLAPTLLDLVGVPKPRRLDGQSLVPLMRCEPPPEARPLFFSVEKESVSLAGVLVDQSKLIVDRTSGGRRLFFLDENPEERPIPVGRRPGVQELKNHLGDLLESFEWSVQPGLHVELAGIDGQKDRRAMVLRITTDGRFSKARSSSFEPGDRFQISRDGRTLRVDSHLVAFWHRSPKHVWVQDRDELHLQLDPPNADLTVSVELNGRPAPRPHLRFPEVPRERGWPVTLTGAQLADTDSLVDRRIPGVYIYTQGQLEPQQVAQVSEEVSEALRALGYLQ